MVRSLFSWVLAIGLLANSALAVARADRYRIELVGGRQLISQDAPERRGSVLIFHGSPDGTLQGVPVEMVLRVERGGVSVSDRLTVATSRDLPISRDPADALEPGEVVVLGPTGGNRNASESESAASNAAAPAASYPPWNGYAYGAGYGGGSTNLRSLATPPAGTVIGSDGLPRVVSTTDLTFAGPTGQTPLAPNGFPATPGSVTMIGPDGTPVLMPGAGAAVPVIGPNGTPVVSPSTPTAIGPNGFPLLAQPGQPGSAQPVIGANGTPVAAPAGLTAPGQPTLGPSGMRVTAPALPSAPAIPNSPAAPAPGGGSSTTSSNSGGPQ
jgi:hypothetical protein